MNDQTVEKKNNDLLLFSVVTLVTVGLWTGLEVYRAVLKAKPPEVTSQQLLNIDPSLDTTVLEKLESFKSYAGEVALPVPTEAVEP